jgi:ADP-ribose pyrophosphatase YjhB (NUDIX family)
VALANERLRALLLERRVTTAKLAEAVQVDAKTVERWIVVSRVPYRKHRYNVAAFFGELRSRVERSETATRRETSVSPRRIDFYDDPDAPQANSLVPSVNVVVVNDAGEILMIRRTANDNWTVPGGAINLGESVAQAAVRETREESGVECEITGITGIYSDPKHVVLYTSNGEARQEFSIVLTARPLRGQPTSSSESSEVRGVPVPEVRDYTMDRSMRIRINDYLDCKESPVVT